MASWWRSWTRRHASMNKVNRLVDYVVEKLETMRVLNILAQTWPLVNDEGQFFIKAWLSCKDILLVFAYFLAATVNAHRLTGQTRLSSSQILFPASNDDFSDAPHKHLLQQFRTSSILCFFVIFMHTLLTAQQSSSNESIQNELWMCFLKFLLTLF